MLNSLNNPLQNELFLLTRVHPPGSNSTHLVVKYDGSDLSLVEDIPQIVLGGGGNKGYYRHKVKLMVKHKTDQIIFISFSPRPPTYLPKWKTLTARSCATLDLRSTFVVHLMSIFR